MFIILILLAVLTIAAFVIMAFTPTEVSGDYSSGKAHPKLIVRNIGFGLLALFVLVFLIGSVKVVGTKDVGIETAFGKTSGELSNGIHFVAPWVNVTAMDAAIQTDSYTGGNCLHVRVANQQTACVDISIRWRIEPTDADSLFQNYRTFDNVRDSLVTRELTSAINNQLANYNPLNSVEGASSASNPPLTTIASNISAQMQHEIGPSGIHVLNTIMPIVTFDDQTQARINQLQQQVALTRIADQAIQTNEAQAKANQALSASVNNDPALNEANCLNLIQQALKENYTGLPPTLNCNFTGSSTGSSVIVGSNTKSK